MQVGVDFSMVPQGASAAEEAQWVLREIEVNYRSFPAYLVRSRWEWWVEVPAFRWAALGCPMRWL